MVVSGLPIRIGNKHADEIAKLALRMLKITSNLKIRQRLQVRIGIHSGSCVAGLIGSKMPRYCLFGDTVDIAARMKSTGEAMKIHVSKSTYELLEFIGGYELQERRLTNLKGKGDMRTYWLIGLKAAPDFINNIELETISNTIANKTINNAYYEKNKSTDCCSNCSTKVLHNRRSDDIVTVPKSTNSMQDYDSDNESAISQLVVCQVHSTPTNN